MHTLTRFLILWGMVAGNTLGAAESTTPTDPFSANTYRIERDNLTENSAANAQSSPTNTPNPAKSSTSLPPTAAPARLIPWANTTALNAGWEYLEQNPASPDTANSSPGWIPTTLPHSWNATDTLEKAEYRRDASWYRRTLHFTADELRTHHHHLRFGAAGQSATVYLNNEKLTTHNGGYSAFTAELKHLKPGANTLLVRVSNARDRHLPPLSGDFNQYGGLYREVRLLRTPIPRGFLRDDHGGSGIHATSKIAHPSTRFAASARLANTARLNVSATFSPDRQPDNHSPYLLEITVTDPTGAVASQKTEPLPRGTPNHVHAYTLALDIPAPRLWSPETPHLYTITARLLSAAPAPATNPTELDRVTLRHGFRSYQFTPDNGFFLNGKPYRLYGISRHQDLPGHGPALSDAQHDADLRRIKEAGFNFLRLAHYQQDDYVLQRCDELGILVWEEIPLVNVIAPRNHPPSDELAANARSMLTDLITQHRNHPSIIIWGLGNEISYSTAAEHPALHEYELRLIRELNDIAHRLDPTRKTILVSHDSDRASDVGVMAIPDLNGYNLYRGWYRPDPATLPARLNELHAKNPTKPLILSEFGAGADSWLHSENPRRFDYSEEHMVNTLEATYDLFDTQLNWLAGHNLWVFADFGAAHRVDTHPYINNKGLLDVNRQPKDAYFYLKARLQKADPVLYLQSPTWTTRGGSAQKTYRVFSNMDTVELFHDGKNLGPQTANFRWPLTLRPGANALLAKGTNKDGTTREHGFTVNYDPARAPQAVPVIPKR